MVRGMETEAAVKALSGLRLVIGAAAWLTPRVAGKGFGLDPSANPQSPYLARLFGARDVALGVGTLQATGETQKQWLAIGIGVDAADALAAIAARRAGYLNPISAALVFAPAAAAVALGVVALRYALPDFEDPEPLQVSTRWGDATVTRGYFAGVEVLHVSRHGPGHARLSNHVEHRANIAALRDLGADAAIACVACGILDPAIAPGSLIVFDDLHFPVNRLPDGSLCTLFDTPGEPGRGHWIYDRPFAEGLRAALLGVAEEAGHGARDGGCYGHVDGPRFNTATEIRQLAAAGVTAVSQTAGPETVLCGEAEIPYALMGFTTDFANDVAEHTPIDELVTLMAESTGVFAAVLAAALPRIDVEALPPTGVLYRFD